MLTFILDFVSASLALLVAIPLSVFALELVFGIWPSRKHKPQGMESPATVVLIPAHDEEIGLGETLAALLETLPPRTEVLVVADNCTDQTASVARAAGVTVIERDDPAARGKGFALAFGRDFIAARPTRPDVVVVLDADCWLAPGSLHTLATSALTTARPVQAVYLIISSLAESPRVQISNFAFLIKNLYRTRGMQRLSGAALLTGTGMAFPWSIFSEAALSTGSIVEDLDLGILLTRCGSAPLLVENAHVRSRPAALGDTLVQRRRWEHGFLSALRNSAFPTLIGGIRRRSIKETFLGLHLCVPPFALLLVLSATTLALETLLHWAGATSWPIYALGSIAALALMLTFAAWAAGGRNYLSGSALLHIPLYIFWKLPIYASYARRAEAEWQRTPRRDG